jgi:hypothetical protein
MTKTLAASVTGCSGLLSVNVSDSYNAPTSSASIMCTNSSLDVGDSIDVHLGYSTGTSKVFSGYVKNVSRGEAPDKYEITAANAMVRAVDYFIVSTNPEEPYSKENIAAEDLVRDLMAMAGLTNYSGAHPGFTFATMGYPLEVNLASSYDFSKMVADLIAWHLYADNDGTVHFKKRLPFPDGDGSVATLTDSNLFNVSYWRSDRDLRNRVVVYGAEGIYAEAKASSPYLPNGFYKSVAVAASTIFTDQGMAEDAAAYNLAKLNRLTIGGSASIEGDSSILCRDCVQVNKSDIGMSGQFFVYGCEHDWSQSGFITNLDLRA